MSADLGQDHTFILSLLEHGKLDVQTIATATFRTRSHIQKIIDDLLEKNLVDREFIGTQYCYKRK